MIIKSLLISNENNYKLCKIIFKILNCNLLWIIIRPNNNLFNVFVTDQHIFEHYFDKKYYLHDPNINVESNKDKLSWMVTLGTDCDSFKQNGFLYDLYKIFHVEEFVSIENRIGSKYFCFRFFTKNNRFVFMNKLLNNILLIKYFISTIVKKL